MVRPCVNLNGTIELRNSGVSEGTEEYRFQNSPKFQKAKR